MVIFIGICDLNTKKIYGQNRVPCSASIPSLCDFVIDGCRREGEDLLQDCPPPSQTNQSTTPESALSIVDLRDNYEMEEEQYSRARGGKCLLRCNVYV